MLKQILDTQIDNRGQMIEDRIHGKSSREDFELYALLNKLFKDRGVDFRQYRPKCIARRIATRMRATGVKTYQEYVTILNTSPQEYDHLLSVLTINVTEFFRDPEVFHILRLHILPELIQNKEKRKKKIIRIWSAGCSDGPETYTLAVLLFELLGQRLFSDFLVSIYGTDIDDECITKAREGVYFAKVHMKNVDPRIAQKYFTYAGNYAYAVADKLKIITKFRHQDLVLDKPLSCVDLILCRNVLIYFSRELQMKVFENFYHALVPGGYLVLGRVESVWGEMQKYFAAIDHKNRIYQRV